MNHRWDPVNLELTWKAALIAISLAVLALTVFCLSQGITIIFMHIYYFPIILLSYHYHRKGILLSALLGIAYFALVGVYTWPDSGEIIGAAVRAAVFIGIAAVVSFLSENLKNRQLERDTIIENSENGIIILDPPGRIIEMNRRGADILGCNPASCTLSTIWKERAEQEKFFDSIRTTGYVRDIETRLETGTGEPLTVLLSAGTLPDSRIVLTITDITERERMLTEMKRLNQVQQSIIINANVWLMVLDSRGRVLEWNKAAERISGYAAEEVMGKSDVWTRLYPEKNYRKEITKMITGIIEKNAYFENLLTTIRSRDGTIRTLLWNTRQLPGYEDPVLRYIAIGVDITDRIAAESELRQSEDRYRSFIENFHGIAVQGTLIRIQNNVVLKPVFVHGSVESMTGYTEEDFMSGKVPVVEIFHKDDLPDFLAELEKSGKTPGYVIDYEARIVRKDGQVRWVHITVGNTVDKEGKISLLRGVVYDVTERKLMGSALHTANEKLNLLSSITRHDILNQLTALQGYLELTEDFSLEPTVRKYLDRMKMVSRVIQKQIEFTRIYQDIGILAPAWQDIHATIASAAQNLSMGDVRIEEENTAFEVLADPLLEKVFYNLFDNALRYGEKITTIRCYTLPQGDRLSLLIEDNGVGIADPDKKRLFERGFGKHTGFGLFISREILAITGITIVENGEPGRGARFELIVPAGNFRRGGTP